MIKKKIYFVPGFSGVYGDSWPNWLGQEFAKYGFDFRLLDMPNVMCPEVHEWLDYLAAQKIKADKNTYFIGHSLGCVTIARYLEKLPAKSVAAGCIFVAGFCSLPKFPLLSDFCTEPLDFSLVKNHAEDFVVIMSDNDHIIPNQDSLELAEKLQAKVMIESKKGHFTNEVKELHSALNYILEKELMRKEVKEMKRLRK
jgi:predicted alpha/beta hydrolase family esterase